MMKGMVGDMGKKFKWDMCDFDGGGIAYIVSCDECTNKEDVPQYIVKNDCLSQDVLNADLGDRLCEEIVEEGWCKYQVRSDWDGEDGTPCGGYFVNKGPHMTKAYKGKRGWFKVWIVRVGEWY